MAGVSPSRPAHAVSLREHLSSADAPRPKADVAEVVARLAEAAISLSALIAKGPLAGALGSDTGIRNADGDHQKQLDDIANRLILTALRETAVAYFASEEEDAILTLDASRTLAVAVDPLDGSSNIDVTVPIGTIFSIFEASPEGATASFFRPGSEQLAAGYFVYGSHTALVLTTGAGVDLFVYDRDAAAFLLARSDLRIPIAAKEFAINASNYRHWFEPIKTFIDDCIAGADGPRGKDFNMRWVASLVAETHRIFSRGGIFLYPADQRPGYENGRLRLIYEAAPIAMLAEQAHGSATDGHRRILDKVPASMHERTPLIFGSAEKVERIERHHTDPDFLRQNSPLFGGRGLFRS
jgi:fructose-1,6-bisphosphatase I